MGDTDKVKGPSTTVKLLRHSEVLAPKIHMGGDQRMAVERGSRSHEFYKKMTEQQTRWLALNPPRAFHAERRSIVTPSYQSPPDPGVSPNGNNRKSHTKYPRSDNQAFHYHTFEELSAMARPISFLPKFYTVVPSRSLPPNHAIFSLGTTFHRYSM